MEKKKLENSFSLLWFIQIPIRPRTIGMLIRCSFWNFTVWAGQRVLCIVWHRPLSWPLLDWYTYEHSLFQHLRSAPTQTRAPAELLFTLLGNKDKSWTAPSSIMFLPAAIKNSHTHTYNTFLPLFSLQSHNEWFHPRTPPPLSLSLQLIPEAPRFPLASFFVLSHFIPMLHSNRVIFFFFSFFPLPLSRFSIWASKGLQGLIWCLSLSPQLVCGLRANCRVWSVCELIKISRSPQCSCPLSLQSTSPRYV